MTRPDWHALLSDLRPRNDYCYCGTPGCGHPPPPSLLRYPQTHPGWDPDTAMLRLGITQATAYPNQWRDLATGRSSLVDGCAWREHDGVPRIWFSPTAGSRLRTAAHEIAHVVFGHIDIKMTAVRRACTEAEAEGTAMLVMAGLGLDATHDFSRWYIAGYLQRAGLPVHIPAPNIAAMQQAAQTILSAGMVAAALPIAA